jgi:hypothetical protein
VTPEAVENLGIAATYYREWVHAVDETREPGKPFTVLAGDMKRIVNLLHNAQLEIRRLTAVETELRADIQQLEQITRHTAG